MFRNIMVLLLVCAALDINAMKRCNEHLIKEDFCQKVQGNTGLDNKITILSKNADFAVEAKEEFFLLNKLPVDIQNYIATFMLDNYKAERETKRELIERAHPEARPYVTDWFKAEGFLSYSSYSCEVYCPDVINQKILFIDGKVDPNFRIFPSEYSDRKKKLTELTQKIPRCFAVSEKKQFTAEVIEDSIFKNNENNQIYVLNIINIATQKERKIPLEINHFTGLAFNQQGTKIVVFGMDSDSIEYTHDIVSLKIKEKNLAIKKLDKKDAHLLQNYFNKRMVCKALKKSSPEEI